MTNPRQRKSRLHLVAVTTLTLLVACSGSDPNTVESLADIPENVDEILTQSLKLLLAGAESTDAIQARLVQLQLQTHYRDCITDPSTCRFSRVLAEYEKNTNDVDPRATTITINAWLPNGIVHQQRIEVGEGCASDDPINQWTDADSVAVYYIGKDQDTEPPFIDATCQVRLELHVVGTELVIKKDIPLKFGIRTSQDAERQALWARVQRTNTL